MSWAVSGLSAGRALMCCAALATLLGACASEESPKESVLRFLRAVEESDREQVYKLLAPESQRLLGEIAAKANIHTGGGRRLVPQDLFAVGQERPASKIGELKVLEVKGDRARVQLETPITTKQKGVAAVKGEVLELIRVDSVWRVKLPIKH